MFRGWAVGTCWMCTSGMVCSVWVARICVMYTSNSATFDGVLIPLYRQCVKLGRVGMVERGCACDLAAW